MLMDIARIASRSYVGRLEGYKREGPMVWCFSRATMLFASSLLVAATLLVKEVAAHGYVPTGETSSSVDRSQVLSMLHSDHWWDNLPWLGCFKRPICYPSGRF